MAQFVDNDSGRKRRMDPFEKSHEYGLRPNDCEVAGIRDLQVA